MVLALTPAQRRRWALYAAAVPLFERNGFRGSAIAALARSAGLRPASLYHYFPSKAAFALFPLGEASGLCSSWRAAVNGFPADPEVRLERLIDFIGDYLEPISLAFKLAREMSDDSRLTDVATATVVHARRDFRAIGQSLAPGVDAARADDLFQAMATLVAGHVRGVDRDPSALRRQLRDVARGWLVGVRLGTTGEPSIGRTTVDTPVGDPPARAGM